MSIKARKHTQTKSGEKDIRYLFLGNFIKTIHLNENVFDEINVLYEDGCLETHEFDMLENISYAIRANIFILFDQVYGESKFLDNINELVREIDKTAKIILHITDEIVAEDCVYRYAREYVSEIVHCLTLLKKEILKQKLV